MYFGGWCPRSEAVVPDVRSHYRGPRCRKGLAHTLSPVSTTATAKSCCCSVVSYPGASRSPLDLKCLIALRERLCWCELLVGRHRLGLVVSKLLVLAMCLEEP